VISDGADWYGGTCGLGTEVHAKVPH
jgi:hypothetical protein